MLPAKSYNNLKFYDAIVIGGGAAGLMFTGQASSLGFKTLLIEHNQKLGEKIRISGGGRCNFTNIFNSENNFLSNNAHFCVSALKRFGASDFIKMVEKHQIDYHEKTLGQLFCDKSSSQIIQMLLDECNKENSDILTDTKVEKIAKKDDFFKINTNQGEFSCKSLIIATGGLAIPKMGASSFGYEIAKQFGLKVISPLPALVPFTFDEELLARTKILSGIAVDAKVSIGKINFKEAILFTHRGISGPAILQISSYYKKGDIVTINFAPKIDVFSWLKAEKINKAKQEIQNILHEILPKRFVAFILEELEIKGFMADLSHQKLQKIANFINNFNFIPSGNEGFNKAEVCIGGVDVDEISSKTFEAKKVKNLYFIGEVLDVTGHLGGHNFQWAWASAVAAAKALQKN
jgi:predicted Rossmann fold flavoprotein